MSTWMEKADREERRELSAADLRQLDAEADAYQAQADHEAEHASCRRRIAELETALRGVLRFALPITHHDVASYNAARSALGRNI